MAKITYAIRIEPEVLDELKRTAKQQHKNVTDLVNEGMHAARKIQKQAETIAALERENQELRRQLEAKTHRPITTKKRIAIPLTLEEYDAVEAMAAKHHTSKTAILRQALKGRQAGRTQGTLKLEPPAEEPQQAD